MKYSIWIVIAATILSLEVMNVLAIEEAPYKVVEKEKSFEIRDYEPCILAETVVEGDLEEAGNTAFNRLFGYISGKNRAEAKVAMTAPVSQEATGEKIEMTAPVAQQRVQERWAVSFMMPTSYTLETLPQPEDPKVTLRQVPARRMATVRYSGLWSEKSYREHKLKLESWIKEKGLSPVGESVWARYNPPFTPWFLRRNEIQIPIKSAADIEKSETTQ